MNKIIVVLFAISFIISSEAQQSFASHSGPDNPPTGHCLDELGGDFSNCNFNGFNLSGFDFSGADFSGANLREAFLVNTNFSGANLSGADLRGAFLTNAILTNADLSLAMFTNNLGDVADLSGADLHCLGDPSCIPQGFCGAGTIVQAILQGNECIPDPNLQPIVCGQGTTEILGICVPNLNQICGQGTIISGMQCIAQQMNNIIGGTLLEIDNYSLFIGAVGTNPVITGLVTISIAGVAGQAVWFIHKKKKNLL